MLYVSKVCKYRCISKKLTTFISQKCFYHRLISPHSVIDHYLVAVHCVRMEVVQCYIVLLVSYGVELSVVETIHSDTLVVALI